MQYSGGIDCSLGLHAAVGHADDVNGRRSEDGNRAKNRNDSDDECSIELSHMCSNQVPHTLSAGPNSPSPGTPGEGWGGGSREGLSFDTTPSLTLPRSTGGGDKTTAPDKFQA